MPAWCGSDESPPFGSPTPAFLLYPHVAERENVRERSLLSLLTRSLIPSWGLTFMKRLPSKGPISTLITLGFRVSAYWGQEGDHHSDHNRKTMEDLILKHGPRGWDGWIASPTQWTWVWVNSGSWWWTGKPGLLQSMGSQRIRHDWATELNWTELKGKVMFCKYICHISEILELDFRWKY